MVYLPSVKATKILQQKAILKHRAGKRLAVFEIVVRDVGKSPSYPAGIKYRAWVSENQKTLIGFDNHRPKGPHIHLGDQELPYVFKGIPQLRADIIRLIELEGFVYES